MLYSLNGQYPNTLPFRIVLSDGRTRTDPSTFTEEEIADAGLVAVPNPPTSTYPQRVDWTGSEWIVREPNDAEVAQQWNNIRATRNQMLQQSDIYVLRSYESGVAINTNLVQYRQALRDITTQPDPWNIVWPTYTAE